MFLFGLVVGAAAASLIPPYVAPYFGDVLAPSTVVEGEVMEKESQPERVVLKVNTAEGVLLARFTD